MKNIHYTPDSNHEFSGDSESDVSHLLKHTKDARNRKPIALVEVKPREDSRVPLGIYSKERPPKGFMVEINPDPDPPESITTKVVSLLKGKSEQYELTMLLDNYGVKTVTVEVWEMK
jgi:hypothetical protein